MQKIAALLDGSPPLPKDVLRRLERDRARAVLALHQQAGELLGRHEGLVGPWLSHESIQAIITKIAAATARLYLDIGWAYAGNSAALAKIKNPHPFLECLASKLATDAWELFKEVTAGAWLQCGPLPLEDDSPVDPREYVPQFSRVKSETLDSDIFLGQVGWTVTAPLERVRRKLEERMLLRMSERTTILTVPTGEPESLPGESAMTNELVTGAVDLDRKSHSRFQSGTH